MSQLDSDSDISNITLKRKCEDENHVFNIKKTCTDDWLRNKTTTTTRNEMQKMPTTRKKVVQRKFPGPAGLLTTCETSFEKQSWKDLSLNTSINEREILCSQASVAAFNTPVWKRMLHNHSISSLVDKCNIEWIKRKAAQKQFIDQKAPFLAAVIQSIELSVSTVTLFLKDPTGEIQAHIPCKLYKEHANELIVGAVVVLKQPAVLTLNFGQSHYLILIESNLMQIYYPNKSSNDVNLIELQDFNGKELLLLYSIVETRKVQTDGEQCSQIQIKSQNPTEEIIIKSIFDGIDANSFFDDEF